MRRTENFLQLPEFSRDALKGSSSFESSKRCVALFVGLGKTYQAELIAEAVRSR